MDYLGYAQEQSDAAEKIIVLGEKMGKHYHCLNETFIPALRRLDHSQ
jgi:hypothetical protein